MFSVEGNNIYITKGNSAYLTVYLGEINGCPHKMAVGDKVILTVKASTSGQNLMQVVYTESVANTNSECTLHITASNTASLEVGQYSCDVEYRTGSDVYTIFPSFSQNGDTRVMKGDITNWKNFWVLPRVTNAVASIGEVV